MRSQFDSPPSRRQVGILNRWTMYPADHISLWMADMDFRCAPQILSALRKQVEHGVLGYDLLDKSLLETISSRMWELYQWKVDPDSIVYTAGVNHGYNVAARMLCDSKRGYLIQTPVYNEFQDTQVKTGFRQLTAPLLKIIQGNRISYGVDFDAFKMQVKNAGMFLLCHPHNPVGRIYSRAELKEMAKICIENNVTIVSDEIHSELLLGGEKFTPLAKLSKDIEKHTITLISASKAFNIPGLACAFAIIPDPKLRKRFFDIANGMSIEYSTPGLTASQVAYSGRADAWLRDLCLYLTSNRDFAAAYIEKYMQGMRATVPDATYLMWLDCSEIKLKSSPHEFFLKQAKIVLSDGAKFGNECSQFVRLNFGTSRAILKKGLDRMRTALAAI